jgi:hypothetical protein
MVSSLSLGWRIGQPDTLAQIDLEKARPERQLVADLLL